MQYLRQSTASQEITLGYFLDSTDGNTAETGLTIANTDIKVRKGGGTTLTDKNSGGATHISGGIYTSTLDATDTNTLGMTEIYCHVAGALATKSSYTVLHADAYDALITNGDIATATGFATTAEIADVPTVAEFNARTRLDADYFSWATDTVANVTTVGSVTTKTGYAVSATGLDLVLENSTYTTAVSARIWNEILTGGTFNTTTSAGRRLRGLADTFIVHEGTADAGGTATITFETGTASSVDNIYEGDRVIITGGTGIGEHGIILSYVGSTRVATMSQNWVVTPDATSTYEVTPADVDIESWQHVVVSNSATTGLPEVDAKSISDDATAANNLELDYDGTGYAKANSTMGTVTTNTDLVSVSDIWTTQLTEAYAADTVAGTGAQLLFMIQQILSERDVTSTTLTIKKLDGSTTASTFTLDSATVPTNQTRTT